MTAKSHGLEEECRSILEASGMTEDQINLAGVGQQLQPSKPIVATYKANWPVKAASHSFFEKALLGESGDDGGLPASNGFDHRDGADDTEADSRNNQLGEDEEEDAAGWDMGR